MTFALGRDFPTEVAGLVNEQIARISMGLQGGRVALGGTSGSGGGTGVPPGGFVGQLIQKKVTYDTSEEMSVETTSGSSLLDNLNHMRAWLDPARWLRAQAQDPPDMTVYVRPGIVYFTGWGPPVVWEGGNSPAFTAPPSQNRIDVLYMEDDGSLNIEQGVAGADPVPTYPTSGSPMAIWEIYLRDVSTSILNTDDGTGGYIHRDVRPFLNLGGGDGGGPHTHIEADITDLLHNALKIQGRTVATTAPSDNEVYAWNAIASEWQPEPQSGSGGFGGPVEGGIVLTARGGAPRTDSGCASPTKQEIGTTHHLDKFVLAFDKDADEFAQWAEIIMPADWDGGTIAARFEWTCNAGVGGAGKTVCWGLRGRSWGDDEAIDQALGTAQFVTDTWLADKDTHISAESSAITLAGTPAAGEAVLLEAQRDVSEDDLAGDAWLIAVYISYTREGGVAAHASSHYAGGGDPLAGLLTAGEKTDLTDGGQTVLHSHTVSGTSVEVQEDDVKVADATIVNFEGGGGKVTDEGGGKVTVDIAGGGAASNMVFETNDDDIIRVDTAGDSAFAAQINGAPSGANVTYKNVTGNENSIKPASASQIGKLILYNTTRGNSALIQSVNTATDVITLTANAPAGWADNDNIQVNSQTVTGGPVTYFDVDLSGFLPANASGLMVIHTVLDTGVITGATKLHLHPWEAFAGGKNRGYEAQVAGLPRTGFGILKVNSQKITLGWDATGAATLTAVVRLVGWIESG